jgi:hypothetical protein
MGKLEGKLHYYDGAEHQKDGKITLQDRTQKESGNLRRVPDEVSPISFSLLWSSNLPSLQTKLPLGHTT